MPFTFAHPAAVLPLRRFKLLHTVPLMIGSVAPDLPYYVPARFTKLMGATHTVAGAFWLDIPIGLAVLLFVVLLRRALTALMTPRARALCLHSLEEFRHQPLHWLLAIVAIYVGTWTHLVWDSFTHDNAWGVRRVAALSAPVTIGAYTGTMCHVLQYVSSVAGLLILAIWYLRLPTPAAEPSGTPVPEPVIGRGAILFLLGTAALIIGCYLAFRPNSPSNYRVIYLLLTRTIAWFVALYLATGLVLTFGRRKPEPLPEV